MKSTTVALPLMQGLVTVLALCTAPFAEADVSHVLRGEARPPPQHVAPDPREVNSLTADAGDYWWMAEDSPFRAAYDEYKKCGEKGNCVNGGGKAFATGRSFGVSANADLPPIDIKKNPFFNGAIQSNSLASGQGSKIGGGGHAFHSGASIDISKNPFLNGEFVAGNGDKVKDANGFIGVQPKKPGFATIHPLASNKPGFATSPPVGQQAIVLNGSSSGSGSSGFGGAASFTIASGQTHQGGLQSSKQGPSQPAFGQAARSGAGPVACTVKNHGCVPKQLCVNGFVTGNAENLLLGLYCNPETEVCCQLPSQVNSNLDDTLRKLSRKTIHPTSINDLISSEKKLSSGSAIKFVGANGSSPITIQVIGGENDDGKTQYTSGSSIQASTLKPTREANSNENSVFGSPIDYSNVHFDSNVRFASTIQGPEYLPPLEGTTPSISTYQPSIPTTPRPVPCPSGTQRIAGGLCESLRLPECPPGTIRKPDNSCGKPACPYGYEQQPDGSCRKLQPPTTPQSPTTPSCPPGTYPIGGGRCSSPSTTVSSCPPGTLRRPDGSCGPRTSPTPTPCPPGTHLTSLGECAPNTQQSVCPFGAVRLPDGTCQTSSSPRPCPPGTFLTASGACGSSSTPTTPAPRCPPGTIQQADGSCQRGITPLPTCPPGTFRGPSGECRTQPTPLPGCPIGTTRQSDGSCQRTCPQGSFPGPNGECRGPSTPSSTPRCPAGTIQQPDGSCQRPSSPPPTCPPGSFPGSNGECRGPSTPSPTPRCPTGTIQQPDGSCQRPSRPPPACPPGSFPGPNGECRGPSTPPPSPRCPTGTIQQPNGSCQRPSSPIPTCPPGSFPGPDGECRRPTTPASVTRCPVGTVQQTDGSCQRPPRPCPPGTYQGYNGECKRRTTPTPRCPIGTIQQPDGSCQRPSSPVSTCPPGSVQGPNGECTRPTTPAPVCPVGTIQQSDGSCQRPISPTSCPPNTYLGPSGSCEPARAITTTGPPAYEYPRPCPPGTVKTASGTCEVSPSSPRPACPPGTRSTPFGTCEPILSATTPKPPPRPFERPTTPELNKDYLPPKPTTQYVPSVTTHRPHETSTTTEHRTSFTSSTQHPPFSTPRPFTAITKPSCRQGQILSSNGVCIYPQTPASTPPTRTCPHGTKLSPFTNECVKSPSGFTTGYEYQKPTTPFRPTTSTQPRCGSGQVLSSSGICTYPSQITKPSCKPGETLSSSGECVHQRTFEPSTSKPSCPSGQVPSASGYGCEYPKVSTPPPSCPLGTKLNRFTKQCEKTPESATGYEYPRPTTPSKPQCGPGETLSPSGYCSPVRPSGPSSTPRPSCRRGEVLSASGECVYPVSSTPRPPFGQTTAKPCPPGQVPSTSGFGCEYPRTPVPSCPPGTKLSPFTKECVQAPATSTGYEYQRPTTTSAEPPKPTIAPGAQCGPGRSLSPTGRCITVSTSTPRKTEPSCGPGQVHSASGACVYQTAVTSRPTFGPSTPSCLPGQILSASGNGCEYPRGPSPVQSCPPGTRLSSFSNKCEKTASVTPGYEYPRPSTTFTEQPRPTISPRPQCGPGQSLSPSGQCVFPSRPVPPTTEPSTPKLCPPGQIPSASGYGCEYPKVSTPPPSCPLGTKLNRFTKQCEKTPQATTGYEYPRPTTPSKPQCGPGETLSPSGYCSPLKPYGPSSTPRPSCRRGEVLSASGECVYPVSSTPRPPFGQTTAKPCPPGQVPSTSGFGCEYPRTPVPSCPPGTKLSPFTKECVQAPATSTGYEYQRPTTTSAEPPKSTIAPGAQCGPGRSLSPTGRCITVSTSTPRKTEPSCGPGQIHSASGACVYQTAVTSRPTFGPSTSTPSCLPGQILSASGNGCEYPRGPSPVQSCPPGTRLSSFSNKCEKTPSVTPGYKYPEPSTTFTEQPRPTISPRPQCGPGQSLSPSGQCVFPSRPVPPTTEPSTPKLCPPGQVPSAAGYGCEYPKVSTPPTSCPLGTKLNRFTKQCEKTPEVSTNYEYPRPTTPSKPQCGPGETLSPSGYCSPVRPSGPSSTPRPSCRRGEVLSASGECVYPVSSTPRPPFGQTTAKPCPPGQVPSTSGFGCEYPRTPVPSCPPGTKLSPFTKECLQAPATSTGYEYQRPTTTSAEPPKPTIAPGAQCGPGRSLSPTGRCITVSTSTPRKTEPSCGPGQIHSASGACVYQTAVTSRPTFGPSTSTPSCLPGQILSASGNGCEYPRGPSPVQSCPPGTRLSSFSNKCEKTPSVTPGYEYPRPSTTFTEQPRPTISPRPQCGPGQSLSPSGQCVFPSRPVPPTKEPSTPKLCPPGQVPSAAGYGCEYPKVSTPPPSCPLGTKLNRFTKQCEKTPEASTGYEYPKPTTSSKPQCGPGETLSPSGYCSPVKPYGPSTPRPSCRRGEVLSASGECVYPVSSTPRPPFGQTTAKPCPPGQVPSTSGFGCEYPRTPVPSCPPGTKLSPFTKECVQAPATSTGYEYQRPTTTSPKPPKPTIAPGAQCGPGRSLSPTGRCITVSTSTSRKTEPSCGPGQVNSASGACVYQTTVTSRPTFGPSTSTPSCPPGLILSASGNGCEYPRGPSSVQSCPPGTKLSSFSNKCEKAPGVTPGYEYPKPSTPFTEQPRPTISPRPQCGPGQSLSPSGQCVFPSRPVPPTTEPSTPKFCPPGQVPSAAGYGCEYPKVSTPPPSCPLGTKLNRFTKQCEKTPEASTGYEYPKPTTSSKPQCGPGETLSPSGYCSPVRPSGPSSTPRPSCRRGEVLSASGECVYPVSSTPRPPFGQTTAKPCPPGQVPSTSGFGCEYPRTPVPSCPPGTKLSPFTKECVQAPATSTGYEYQRPTTTSAEPPKPTIAPGAQCGPGRSLSPTGQCITVSTSTSRKTEPSCGPGQIHSASGACVYQTAVTSRPTFGPSTPSCLPGQILSASGNGCEYPRGPSPVQSCPPGTRLSSFSNKCEKTPSVTPGYEYPRPSTTFTEQPRPTISPRPQCGPGQSLSPSGQCVFPSRPVPPTTEPSTPKLCPPGQVPSAAGYGCEYPKVSTPPPSCPLGTKLNRFTKQCEKTPEASTGYEYPKPTSPSKPQCGPGETLSPSGYCSPVRPSGPSSTARPSCRHGEVLSASGECVYPVSSTPRPPFGQTTAKPCPPGQVPSTSGFGCEYPRTPVPSCPPGTKLSPFTKECVQAPATSTGYEYQRPTTTSAEPPKPTIAPGAQCGPGRSLSPTGRCITVSTSTPRKTEPSCGPGQAVSASDGSCVYKTAVTSRPTFRPSTSIPSCPPGQILSASGNGCEYRTGPSPVQSCPPGTRLSSFSNKCEKAPGVTPGYEYPKPSTSFTEQPRPTISPRPQCGPGQSLSPSGQCVFPSRPGTSTIGPYTPKLCPPGQIPSDSGYGCEYPPPSCPLGTKLNRFTKQCDKAPEVSTNYEYPRPTTPSKPQCGPGETLSPSGYCSPGKPYGPSTPRPSCRPGEVLSASGTCVYPVSSTPKSPFGQTTAKPCPPGQIPSAIGTGCEYPRSSTASTFRPTGYEYQKPTTFSPERPQPTFRPQCGPGESLSPSGQCATPTGYQYPNPTTPLSEIPRPTSRPRCRQGQVLSASGRCVPSSIEPYRPQPSSTVKPSCAPGQIVSDSGICAYPSKPSFSSSTPRVCPAGQVPAGSDCIYPSKPTTYRPSVSTGYEYQRPSTSYSPKCSPGESLSSSGKCISPSNVTPKSSCGSGQILSASGACVYASTFRPTTTISPERPQSTSKPHCAPGESLSPSGQCVTPSGVTSRPSYRPSTPPASSFESSTPKSCPPGQILSASGVGCEYPQAPRPTTYRPSISTGYDYKRPTTPFPERSHPSSRPLCAPGESLSPSGQCVTPSGATSRPTCGPGQVLTSSGDCVSRQTTSGPTFGPSTPKPCPPGQIPSTSGLGCEYPSGGSTFRPSFGPSTSKPCPSGQILSESGVGCEYPKAPGPTTYRPRIPTGYQYPKPTQPFREPLKPTPPSRCGPGQTLSASGICVYPSGSSECAPGQTLSPSGKCVDKTITTYKPSFGTSTTKPSCPPGQVPSTSGVGCEYPRGPTACRSDQIISSSGECIDRSITTYKPSFRPSTSKPSCPPGQVPSASGVGCEYLRGVTPSRPSACKPGQTLSPSGVCIDQTISTYKPSFGSHCPPGQVPSASGIGCEYPQGPKQGPSVCPSGQILSSSGSCIPVSQKPCPPGQTRSNSGICVQTTIHPHTVNHFTTTSPKVRPTARPSGGYNYETPTPTFGYPSSPLDSSQNNINSQYASTISTPRYTPQRPGEGPLEGPDNTVDSANANSFFVPTTRQPVTVPQQSYNRQPAFNGGQQLTEEASPPVGCAAALKCVQEIYCTADGFVSPVPVVLTKEQELLRVPTTTCKDIETGIIGKCCRDPNYKDPWPSANLVNGVDDGQYKEDNFYGQRELVSNRLTRASNLTGAPAFPPALRKSTTQEAANSGVKCGNRNLDSSPKGESTLDANFAEYPWQAMILRDSNRSLLCGGVIIRDNAVLTSAHCVEGLDTNDVLAKGGEWKLGIDEEPLPFQIVKVGAIIRHPEYKPGSYHNDVAILVLREKLRFTKNIGPLCLSQTKQISSNSKCKLTGWGKRILQLHARGAIMHHIDVNVMENQKCQEQLSEKFKESLPNYSTNMICGQSNIDHCKVDYGSALACENDQGQYEFAGIYTWDTGCNQEGQIAGFVKPDTDWIQTTLRKPIKEIKRIEREYLRSH